MTLLAHADVFLDPHVGLRVPSLGDLLTALLPVSLATDFTKSFTSFGGVDLSGPTGPLGRFIAGAPHEESDPQVGEPAMA